MRIAFYKEKGKFVDYVIRWVTNSKYSHCELLFEDGKMFSSDAWHGGARWNTKYSIENWDIVDVPCSAQQELDLIGWCMANQNTSYDWKGVIRFILPVVMEEPNKLFCSELCAEGLKVVKLLPKEVLTYKLSPGELYTILTLMG